MVNCARRIPDRRCNVHRASRQDLVGRRRGVRTSKGRQGPWCGRSRTPVGGRMATAVHESPDSPPAGCVVQAPPSSASPTTGSLYRVHTDMQSRSQVPRTIPLDIAQACGEARRIPGHMSRPGSELGKVGQRARRDSRSAVGAGPQARFSRSWPGVAQCTPRVSPDDARGVPQPAERAASGLRTP
jgi:hypothetical protein